MRMTVMIVGALMSITVASAFVGGCVIHTRGSVSSGTTADNEADSSALPVESSETEESASSVREASPPDSLDDQEANDPPPPPPPAK